MFVATLDGIFKYPDIPEEYEPYVQFKATIEKREVKDGDDLAILSISGTDSHHVLFLDSFRDFLISSIQILYYSDPFLELPLVRKFCLIYYQFLNYN